MSKRGGFGANGAWEVDTSKLSLEGGFAGLAALVPMAVVMYGADLFGLPAVHLPTILGKMMVGSGTDPGYAYLGGLIAFVAMAVGLGVAYARGVARWRPEGGVGSGAIFGAVAWLVLQVVVFPIAGLGFFGASAHDGLGLAAVSLGAFLAFGAALGAIVSFVVRRTAIETVGNGEWGMGNGAEQSA